MVRALTDRDKRTLRFGGGAVVVYLAIFYGGKGVAVLEEQRDAYTAIAQAGERLKFEILQERNKARRLDALRAELRIELASLDQETVVGETRNAIRQAAKKCGVGVSTFKELPGSAGARYLATIQLAGGGPVLSTLAFIQRLRRSGYPILFERLALTAGKPGQVSFSMAAVVVNFTSYQAPVLPDKKPEARDA